MKRRDLLKGLMAGAAAAPVLSRAELLELRTPKTPPAPETVRPPHQPLDYPRHFKGVRLYINDQPLVGVQSLSGPSAPATVYVRSLDSDPFIEPVDWGDLELSAIYIENDPGCAVLRKAAMNHDRVNVRLETGDESISFQALAADFSVAADPHFAVQYNFTLRLASEVLTTI